ncbi:MAG TPA: aminotransferase class I/II-fold pyridoxal phosphate-dependent enzyme [Candidatus Sulfotelmatobacter sp.]|nr:aminotransferase class I/II-fold pyridoxal phosphate-dependent enzyme [Candidatus Sulfotelmatobacter sp.]
MSAYHGGDLTAVAREFGRDPAALLDFSANVNPLGPPAGVLDVLRAVLADPRRLSRYPDPRAAALVEVAARALGVAADRVVVGNGGAALLDAAVRALGARRCVLPVPAFSEYARALGAAGIAIVPVELRAADDFALDLVRLLVAVHESGADLCVLANPHNPSGALLPRPAMLALVAELAQQGCAAIVDEAFVDYVPGESIVGELDPELPVVVLRSLTKFYAIPGLRIGYASASPALAPRLRDAFPSWPTGSVEQAAARAALADEAYAHRTRRENAAAREPLVAALTRVGVRVLPSAANFLLLDVSAVASDAIALRARLVREEGIVVRAFPGEPALESAYLRVAVRAGFENAQLVAALERATDRRHPA